VAAERVQSPIYSGWIWRRLESRSTRWWRRGIRHGWYSTSADIDAEFFDEEPAYQEFSVTPAPFPNRRAGNGTTFSVAVARWRSRTSSISPRRLPRRYRNLSPSAVNSAVLNSLHQSDASSSLEFDSLGSYTVNIIGASGSVSHTNSVTVLWAVIPLATRP